MATELSAAVRALNQGQFEAARDICQGILAEHPDDIRALNILGASLANTGKTARAVQVVERLCVVSPGNPVFYSNLSNLHGRMGHLPEAALAIANAVLSDTKNTAYQARFAQMIEHLMFHRATAETEVIKKATQVCMANPAIDAALFSNAWHSLLLLDPVFTQLATLSQDGDFRRKAEEVNIGEFTEFLATPFVLLGLRSLHATNAEYERVMTFLRYLLVSRIADYDPDAFLPFLCAMAEHCNLNEYVYGCTKEELAMVDALEGTLDLSSRMHASSMARLALVSCYKDPMSLDCANAVTQAEAVSKNDAFAHFVR